MMQLVLVAVDRKLNIFIGEFMPLFFDAKPDTVDSIKN